MKDLLIILPTSDINSPASRRCIEHLQQTDLSLAELLVYDSVYDDDLSYPRLIQSIIELEKGRPIILIYRDVIIKEKNWIDKILEVRANSNALLVGTRQSSEDVGIVTSGVKIISPFDALSIVSFLHSSPYNYVPAVSEGLLFISDTGKINIDITYKYNCFELDMCMQAWSLNEKVACAEEIKTISPRARLCLEEKGQKARQQSCSEDIAYFISKWKNFIENELYNIKELAIFA
ncbi:hypothetical protein MCHI_002933 [Candidatus Magnetoovum chiemensis]|nr:hypothetical protein MCHI_002933 [Candidatus Magnetoovum chiemensis]